MSSKIRALPLDVVNQIAAGEVVERPAHLVKELLENALDAGATEIEVDIEQGGRFVRVKDNGAGLESDDLVEALKRHSTSKIETAEDLWNLSSFGFRGEALASIAAVSRLTLTSRTAQAETASQIKSEFGVHSSIESVGGGFGTSVEVRDLFSNIPARLKFLKSDAAELTHIKMILKAMALANPSVQFRLQASGKNHFFWLKEAPLQRVQRILEVSELYSTTLQSDEVEVEAWLAPPHVNVASTRGLWFFAQGRFVQDRVLQSAVIDAYRGLLMHGQYPIAVVKVKVPPEDIDVNIHPAKSQVKYLDSSKVFRTVQRAIREVLERAPWLPERFGGKAETSFDFVAPLRTESEMTMSFSAPEISQVQYAQKTPFSSTSISAGVPFEAAVHSPSPMEVKEDTVIGSWSQLQILGQLRLTYILAQTSQKLLLIDQHAAHERVAYEKLMRAWTSGSVDVQRFLLPLTLDLDAGPMEVLGRLRPQLEKFGIEFELMSPTCLSILSGPSLLTETALVMGLKSLAQEAFEVGESFALEKVIADVCATMACHSVVRAGQALGIEQMRELLQSMDEFPLSSFCPHGRPVCIEWSFDEIEREFGRQG